MSTTFVMPLFETGSRAVDSTAADIFCCTFFVSVFALSTYTNTKGLPISCTLCPQGILYMPGFVKDSICKEYAS